MSQTFDECPKTKKINFREITEEFIPSLDWEPNMIAIQGIKIYRLNEYEYWAGPSLEECIAKAIKETGISREEVVDEHARELTKEEMIHFTRIEDNETEKISFLEALEKDLENIKDIPYAFAGTEW